MNLPLSIKNKIESKLENIDLTQLKKVSFELSNRYLNKSGKGDPLIINELDALVYASIRMPATYGVCYEVLEHVKEFFDFDIDDVVDIGSGTGSASFASFDIFRPKKIMCLETNPFMRKVGEYLFKDEEINDAASYIEFDLNDGLNTCGDLLVSSFVLNELSQSDREKAIIDMFNHTNKVLVIIEPGTPKGFQIIKEVRKILLDKGGYIIAPCPHMNKCPIEENDWCHFSSRISRSKLHKLLKEGDAPFEDEKYSYIAISKLECHRAENRVMRHPIINKGFVNLEVCSSDGYKKVTITRKEKDKYKMAKKLKVGDTF